ncbi:hypothetical protein CUZ97_2245 [Enterococcus faecium]|nr:hypothetical protein [Enterococcus faecium]
MKANAVHISKRFSDSQFFLFVFQFEKRCNFGDQHGNYREVYLVPSLRRWSL